jgi:hypothetical protein
MKDKNLWQGNSKISHEEIRQKWKSIIGEDDIGLFIKKLELTVGMRKEYIKRCCKVKFEDGPQFEKEMIETIKILELAFGKN